MKPKDKRYTISQVTKELDRCFDLWDQAIGEVLHEEFGFGEKRMDRLRLAFRKKMMARMNKRIMERWATEMNNC